MIRACTCTTAGPCERCHPTDGTVTLINPYPPTPKPPRRNRAQRRADARAQVTRDRRRSRVRQSRKEIDR